MKRKTKKVVKKVVKKHGKVSKSSTKEEPKSTNSTKSSGKQLLDTYKFVSDNVPATINIWKVKNEPVPIYELRVPSPAVGTEALVSHITDVLTSKVPVNVQEITDMQALEKEKLKFYDETKKVVSQFLPNENNNIDVLSGIILHRMYGLGFMDILLADNWLEELTINGMKQPISLYHKKFGWCKTNVDLKSEDEIYNLSSQIGRKVGREINALSPIMDAHLLTGDRVASTLFPISTAGNTITIRRFSRNPWTPINMLDKNVNTMSPDIAAFLWQAMQYELNIIVAGGTASGKTSVLNSISAFIPPKQRVLSIEDTREISLSKAQAWNWVPMNSRNANPEGKGEVTMLDLMVASLRMRPDRIIVGEIRRREQAETLFEAMNTGHSVYATMHADTVQQVKRRLVEPPIAIPQSEVEALHLVLIQYRDRRRGMRRTLELAEILTGAEEELQVNYLYRWRPRTDTFEKANESVRVIEDLNLHTGMTANEITQDLKDKTKILTWLRDKNLKDIDEVGKLMQAYYSDPDEVLNNANKGKDPNELIR